MESYGTNASKPAGHHESLLCPVNVDLYHESQIVCGGGAEHTQKDPYQFAFLSNGGHFQNTLQMMYGFIIRAK